jgi:hypothetical protein
MRTGSKGLSVWIIVGGIACVGLWLIGNGEVPGPGEPRAQQASATPAASGAEAAPVQSNGERVRVEPTYKVNVVDEHGSPVPDAAVALVAAESRLLESADVRELGVTDSQGRLGFGGSEPMPPLVLVRKKGFASQSQPLATEVNFVLERAFTVTVKCVDDDRRDPVEGARIAVSNAWIPDPALLESTQSGSGENAILCGTTDEAGLCALDGLRAGQLFVHAAKPPLISDHDELVASHQVSEDTTVLVTLRELWVAGFECLGPGSVVVSRGGFMGKHAGAGHGTPAGRRAFAILQSRFPRAELTSATFIADAPAERVAVVSLWHTRLGWRVLRLPFQRASEFRPTILEAGNAEEIAPAELTVKFMAPDGMAVRLNGCSVRCGSMIGVEVDPGSLQQVAMADRTQIYVNKLVTDQPMQLPPGRYRLIATDTATQQALGKDRDALIELRSGARKEVVYHLDTVLVPLRVAIEGRRKGVDWERARFRVADETGQRLVDRQVYRSAERSPLAPPMVPIGKPLQIRVTAPGFQDWLQTCVVRGEADVCEVRLVPD